MAPISSGTAAWGSPSWLQPPFEAASLFGEKPRLFNRKTGFGGRARSRLERRLQPGLAAPRRSPRPKHFHRVTVSCVLSLLPEPFMHKALILALLAATAAQAQTVTAGARAVVSSETLPVYASMDSTDVKVTLKRGEVVIIGLVLFGSDTTWCAISKAGQSKRL